MLDSPMQDLLQFSSGQAFIRLYTVSGVKGFYIQEAYVFIL